MNFVPPPPPLLPSLAVNELPPSSHSCKVKIIDGWSGTNDSAISFPALWESVRNHLTTEDPQNYSFTFIHGCQQIGPTCGLAALYMVAEHLDANVSSQKIFELAVEKKITVFGEMFSAKHLCQLAQEVIGSKADVILESGDSIKNIPEALFENHLILIPYDTDKNNEPCLQDGKKAHWAILCGIVSTKNNTYVIARQSKSRFLSIWSLEKLIDSNANLKIPNEKVRSGSVLPSEGLSHSLAKQYIVIKKK